MKNKLLLLFSLTITLSGFSQSVKKAGDKCLSLSDAEKILGQKAALTESSSEVKDDASKQRCTFTATTIDPETNNLGHLYYMFEKYDNELSAQNVYKSILTGNQNMPNLQRINQLGDEAMRHTDFENFDLIIVRKGNILIRLKINKLTSLTDASELQTIAKKLTESL